MTLRSGKIRAPPAPSTASAQAPQPYSAGRTVWEIAEIKSIILRWTDSPTLARCLRLSKKGMSEVARVLFREITYDEATLHMSRDTASKRMICNAVTHIDARRITHHPPLVSRKLYAAMNADPSSRYGRQSLSGFLEEYRPEALPIIVEPLRRVFPHVRAITFGAARSPAYGADSWEVTFSPADRTGGTSGPSNPSNRTTTSSRHIKLLRLHLWNQHTPYVIPVARSPSSDYTIEERFNLQIHGGPPTPSTLHDIFTGAAIDRMCDLYQVVYFDSQRVSLEELCAIYNHQSARGHTTRLSTITANNITPFDSYAFLQFAGIASKHLTSLTLFCDRDSNPQALPLLSFADIPIFTQMIRSNLPKLVHLSIALTGIDTAEADCLSGLTRDCLEREGGLKTLYIHATTHSSGHFNIIRTLAPILGSAADVNISYTTLRGWDDGAVLAYLRKQPAYRRAHLSQIDFADLDVLLPSQLEGLRYRVDGKPIRLGRTKATAWLERAAELETAVTDSGFHEVPDYISDFAQTAEKLRVISSSATSKEMLNQAWWVQRAASGAKQAAMDAVKDLQEIIRKSEAAEAEAGEYVKALERIVGGG